MRDLTKEELHKRVYWIINRSMEALLKVLTVKDVKVRSCGCGDWHEAVTLTLDTLDEKRFSVQRVFTVYDVEDDMLLARIHQLVGDVLRAVGEQAVDDVLNPRRFHDPA